MRLANSIHLLVAVMAMLTLTSVLPASAPAQVSVGISVGFAPPELPVYEQPICPGEGYIWTPGYWAWDPDDEDYYWVPGTWYRHRKLVTYGLPAIGAGAVARLSFTKDTGGRE